jgi:hypothetical protein
MFSALNRVLTFVMLAADKGTDAPNIAPEVAAQFSAFFKPKKTAKTTKAKGLQKGGQMEAIFKLLRATKGQLTTAQLAALAKKKNGEPMKVSSFSAAVSSIKSIMDNAGRGEQFAPFLPSDYSTQGRGRKRAELATSDELDAMLEDDSLEIDLDLNEGAEDEGKE